MPPRESRASSYLGRLLEAFRYDAGFASRSELHRHFKESGYEISLSTINKYESGERVPTEEHLSAYVVLLDLDNLEEASLKKCYKYQLESAFDAEYEACKKHHMLRYRKKG